MEDFLQVDHLIEERCTIEDIPIIRFKLKDNKDKLPTIILYHGWSSSKESQRLRAFILANLGYQVIIPDAIYHGKRNRLENYQSENSVKYFWPTILQNIDEVNKIIDYLIENFSADSDRIGVIGHSMGGFTAAGAFTYNKQIKTAVILNGSFNWKLSNEILMKGMGIESDKFDEELEKIYSLDPMNKQEEIIDRPILMLHGGSDKVVSIEAQRAFYESIQSLYSDRTLIQLIEYNNLGHFVTTNMMEEAAKWFKKHL